MKKFNLKKDIAFRFSKKPLIVGGVAKEFYGIRKSGKDIDLIIDKKDHERLRIFLEKRGLIYLTSPHSPGYKKTPQYSNLFGDHGILIYNYEIWDSICLFDYDFLKEKAIDNGECLVISIEKLLFLTSLAIKNEKYMNDLKLIVDKILKKQYKR